MARTKHNALHWYSAGANAASNTNGGFMLPFAHPAQQGWKVVYEDFNEKLGYAADSATYEFTAIGTGTAAVSTGGVLFDNGADADNAGAVVQAITPTIIPRANNKKMFLEVCFQMTAATMASTEFAIGFSADQGGTIGDFVAADGLSWAVDDCFMIGKLDAETAVSFIARQSDVEQTAGFGNNPTTATKHTASVYYDGSAYKTYWDGALQSTVTQTVFNNDAAMGVVAFMRSGAGETQNLLAHYALLAYEL